MSQYTFTVFHQVTYLHGSQPIVNMPTQLYLYVSSDLPGSLSHSVRVRIQNRQALSQRLPHRLTQLVQNKKGDKSFV